MNPCNPLSCSAYALGYCEYDFATGQIMPIDPKTCPLTNKTVRTDEEEECTNETP